MTSQVASVSGNLTAASGAGSTVGPMQMANCKACLYLGGTFSGTVQVQARPAGLGGTFEPIIPIGASAANITAVGVYAFPPMGGDWEFQVACTAFTSGSGAVTLSAGPAL